MVNHPNTGRERGKCVHIFHERGPKPEAEEKRGGGGLSSTAKPCSSRAERRRPEGENLLGASESKVTVEARAGARLSGP